MTPAECCPPGTQCLEFYWGLFTWAPSAWHQTPRGKQVFRHKPHCLHRQPGPRELLSPVRVGEPSRNSPGTQSSQTAAKGTPVCRPLQAR